MQAYSEIVPPTAVTHAVGLAFLGPTATNLVVAKTSLLQVFETRLVPNDRHGLELRDSAANETTAPLKRQPSHSQPPPGAEHRLVLIAEYPVAGIVTSLASIKASNTKSGGEALLVSFKDAKISLVEWDPATYSLSTTSIHYYEGIDTCPWSSNLSQYLCSLAVDPGSRCAALRFGQRHLSILPFRQAGDDLVLGDYDPDLDDAPEAKPKPTANPLTKSETPYGSSFVLTTTALDPSITCPLDLAFLHEYREPTLGVLSSDESPSNSLPTVRKDVVRYTVFTLDLEQRARTPLISVTGLPSDVTTICSLPLPIGGALILGGNEVIHIDQSGKTHATAVNEFARLESSFSMVDQSDLALKLDGCQVQRLDSQGPELLLIPRNGRLFILSFKMDGRTVSGMAVRPVSADQGGLSLGNAASCTASVGPELIFVGSEQSDASLLHFKRKTPLLSRKRSHAEMLGLGEKAASDEEMEDEEDEDDLYGKDVAATKQSNAPDPTSPPSSDIDFTIHDRLVNLAPLGEPVLANRNRRNEQPSRVQTDDGQLSLEIVLPTGCGVSGGLSFLSRSFRTIPTNTISLDDVQRTWPISAHRRGEATSHVNGVNTGPEEHNLLLVSRIVEGDTKSSIYRITPDGMNHLDNSEFEADVETLFAGSLAGGSRVVQISQGELRCYDQDIKLTQILPMIDEETDDELKVAHAYFSDSYLLILRNDRSAVVLHVEDSGDLEEIDSGDAPLPKDWISGCIHKWSPSPSPSQSTDVLYLLNAQGALHVFALPDLSTALFVIEDLAALPQVLSHGHTSRRAVASESLTEVLVTSLGVQGIYTPHIIVRTANDDYEIYRPFSPEAANHREVQLIDLRWRRTTCSTTTSSVDAQPDRDSDTSKRAMRAFDDIGSRSAVFLPGPAPAMLITEPGSLPRVLPMESQELRDAAALYTASSGHVLIEVMNDGAALAKRLPLNTTYGDTGWAVRRLTLKQEIEQICYHKALDLYIIAANEGVDFRLPEDHAHHDSTKDEIAMRPETIQSTLKLLHPTHWSIVDEYSLSESETILCLKTVNLEISENTHQRKDLIAVGTAITRGEDSAEMGAIYVFDIIPVAPDPERPGTDRKLKLIAREEVRGAVTAVTDAGAQGLLLMAQGQKCIVRGLKEDGTFLPVAFIDVQCYVSVLRNLKGTGMSLIGDALKGLWFVGFEQDPYKMVMFGKTRSQLQVLAAEFLPYEKQLFFTVADAEGNLHVYEYNPDNPKSISGQRLLHKSSFHIGHEALSMNIFLSKPPEAPFVDTVMTNGDSDEPNQDFYQILTTHTSGAISLITPLAEPAYRRMSALQYHLTSALDHACGLNPRAHRSVENGVNYSGAAVEGLGRAIVDGTICTRWRELGARGRKEAWGRVGSMEEQVLGQTELELLEGKGLSYL